MSIACWIPKSTNPHSEYVRLLHFFYCTHGYTKAPQCYFTRNLSAWLKLNSYAEDVGISYWNACTVDRSFTLVFGRLNVWELWYINRHRNGNLSSTNGKQMNGQWNAHYPTSTTCTEAQIIHTELKCFRKDLNNRTEAHVPLIQGSHRITVGVRKCQGTKSWIEQLYSCNKQSSVEHNWHVTMQ